MSFYIIIRGPAGSGKSSVAKSLAERLNGYYISIDMVLKKHGMDKVKGGSIRVEKFIKANEIAVPEAKEKLEEGKVVIFEGNFYHKAQIEHLIKNLNYHHLVFTLKANLEECISRDGKRKDRLGEKGIRDVYRLASRFDSGTRIDTGNKKQEEIVGEILKFL